jgi:hypothetical protein
MREDKCKFLGQEFKKGKRHVTHQRDYCIATSDPCLIDNGDFKHCLRRTFLLDQCQTAKTIETVIKESGSCQIPLL